MRFCKKSPLNANRGCCSAIRVIGRGFVRSLSKHQETLQKRKAMHICISRPVHDTIGWPCRQEAEIQRTYNGNIIVAFISNHVYLDEKEPTIVVLHYLCII